MAATRILIEALEVPADAVAGAARNVSHINLVGGNVVLVGTGGGPHNAVFQLQGSIDGIGWADIGSPIDTSTWGDTTDSQALDRCWSFLRWNCTDYTEGTPTSRVAGLPV